MNTINKVIIKRLKSEWGFQLRIYRNVLDWTVILYIVIPFFLYGVLEYYSWWNNIPLWMQRLDIQHLWGVLFIYLFIGGGVRLFVQEADLLFLQRNQVWSYHLKLFGCVYTLLMQFIITALLFACAFPIMYLQYQIGVIPIVALGILTFLFKANLIFLINGMHGFLSGYRAVLAKWTIIVVVGLLYILLGHLFLHDALKLSLVSVILLITLIILIVGRLKWRGRFNIDLTLEQHQRMSVGALIYKDHVPSNSLIRTKRPLVFRESTHLFRDRSSINIIIESGIKAFVRNQYYLRNYLMYTFAFAYAIFQTPSVIQIILLSAHIFLFACWIKMYCLDFLTSSFIELYKVEPQQVAVMIRKCIMIITFPSIFVSLILLLLLNGWIMFLIMLPISVIFLYLISILLSTDILGTSKKWYATVIRRVTR